MFTWICPKCGSEVPPSENDCPNCRAQARAAAIAQPPVEASSPLVSSSSLPAVSSNTASAPPPVVTTSTSTYAPQPSAYQAPAVPKSSSLSPVMVGVFSAVAIVALLAILYVFVLPSGSSGRAAPVVLEKPGSTSAGVFNAHPLAKYIEIAGLRVSEGGQGLARIAFVAVNHSAADLPELDAQITLTSGGQTVFEFPVLIPSIGPYESKDINSAVKTPLKPYELPDWETLKPLLRIVSER